MPPIPVVAFEPFGSTKFWFNPPNGKPIELASGSPEELEVGFPSEEFGGCERGAKASYPKTGAVTFDFSAASAARAF